MTKIGEYAVVNYEIVPLAEASLSVASSAVLYGLSVYSVFFAKQSGANFLLFRLPEHLTRLKQSASIIGLDGASEQIDQDKVITAVKELILKNKPTGDQFFRITIHATDLIPGVRTRDLEFTVSIFMHEAKKILPEENARIKTSLWRRTADSAIPARAKVNGAYVNSALAKQDALDAGFDDCLFLNQNGYVSELSAANIFMVRRGELITPDCASDILEGITRRTIMEIAKELDIPITERKVALTELYAANEVFACGTSAFVAPIVEIDKRIISTGSTGSITAKLRDELQKLQSGSNPDLVTKI